MPSKLNSYINPNDETEVITVTRRFTMTHHNDTADDAKKQLEKLKDIDADEFDEALHQIHQASKNLPPAR